MGFSVTEAVIKAAIEKNDLGLILRGYGQQKPLDHFLTIVLSPKDAECLDRAEITLEANYSTVASDTSDLKDVLTYLTDLIPQLITGTPAPGVIVNGVKDGVATLERIIETENVTGTPVQMTFPITTCNAEQEAIIATLSIEARGQVSNAEQEDAYDPNDRGQAFAKTNMVCNIGGDRLMRNRVVSATDAERGDIKTYSIANWAILRGTQTVVASVRPHCRVTDAVNIWDEIAGLTIYKLQLIIETVPPELFRTTFSDKFLGHLRDAGFAIPAPVSEAEKKAAKKAKAKSASAAPIKKEDVSPEVKAGEEGMKSVPVLPKDVKKTEK
ncbi:hypothetical protein [uncultured Shimia sp.]|uniref:hypothetical protein n=1 Tax=uncultured Shimia sp. TaxID=573152 RepID=UPI0025DFD19D|nr:hypothetical protein [uncultured Shimia sp.]